MKRVIIISEVLPILLSAALSAFVSYGMFNLKWRKKVKAELVDQHKKRYVILSSHKSKLMELPIFLEHIFQLDDLHGDTSQNITYYNYKDRIVGMHQDMVGRIDSIFSDSNLHYLEKEDIDILFKLKEEVLQSHLDILNDNFYSAEVEKHLSDRASNLKSIIDELPGAENTTIYLEGLKFEFNWL